RLLSAARRRPTAASPRRRRGDRAQELDGAAHDRPRFRGCCGRSDILAGWLTMHWGAVRTRYEGWSRGPALAVIAALLALLALACWSPSTAAAPEVRSFSAQQSDLQLYRDIIAGVRAGGNYYEVAAEAQRKGGYPLKPFFTFRLPTHALIYAAVGERVMIIV